MLNTGVRMEGTVMKMTGRFLYLSNLSNVQWWFGRACTT